MAKEKLIYQAFINDIGLPPPGKSSQAHMTLLEVSSQYSYFSKLSVTAYDLVNKVPQYVLVRHFYSNAPNGNLEFTVMLNLIDGLSRREVLLRYERQLAYHLLNYAQANYLSFYAGQRV